MKEILNPQSEKLPDAKATLEALITSAMLSGMSPDDLRWLIEASDDATMGAALDLITGGQGDIQIARNVAKTLK